jgi:hypothetical protein
VMSHVNVEVDKNVLGLHHQGQTGQIPKTLAFNSRFSRLIARDGFRTGIYKFMRLVATVGVYNIFFISHYFIQRL